MTPLEGAVLLLGLIAVPLALLSMGHGYRRAGRRLRGAFWGGVAGYGVGVVLWAWATIAPPVLWDEASPRIAAVVLALLGCGVLGMAVGAAVGRRPRRRAGPVGQVVILAIGALSGLVDGAALEAQDPADLFVVTELDRDVLLAETAPGVPPQAHATSVAVLGSRGVLIVDTFDGPTAMEWFLDRIAERTEAPVRWVVNTHAHGDHVRGNAAVRARFPEATIHAHPATAARLRSEAEASLRRAPGQRGEVDRVEIVAPDVSVETFERIDVGSRAVWLQSLPPAHTEGDMVVWIDGILVAGGLVEEGLPRLEGADLESWAQVLVDLAARGPALVVAGHGGRPESDERAALLHLQRDVLLRAVTGARMLREGAVIDPEAFADLRVRFAQWGVEADAFDEWMARAVEAAREGSGAPTP